MLLLEQKNIREYLLTVKTLTSLAESFSGIFLPEDRILIPLVKSVVRLVLEDISVNEDIVDSVVDKFLQSHKLGPQEINSLTSEKDILRLKKLARELLLKFSTWYAMPIHGTDVSDLKKILHNDQYLLKFVNLLKQRTLFPQAA
jgi:hypothetical protein